jgi:hypothetical protein
MARENLSGGGNTGSPNAEKTARQISATANYASAANTVKTAKNPTQAQINALKKAATANAAANPVQPVPTFDSAAARKATTGAVDEANTAIGDINTAIGDINRITGQSDPMIENVPGGTPKEPTRTLAMDTFRSTLAGFFGAEEMTKPWVNALYNVMSKYYNTGSTIGESLNLSLQDARTSPDLKEFKDRFAPIYALQDRLQKGEAVTVPTIAEFVKSEAELGDVLREAGLGDLATQKFLGTILTDKSVLTATNIITSVFDRIDNAPAALKSDLTEIMKLGASRIDIAKALLTGEEGASALEKKINNLSVFSAAKTQGVKIDMATAEDLASGGTQYGGALTGFAKVKGLERADTLARFGGSSFTQGEAIGASFQQNAAAIAKAEAEQAKESARFGGTSGLAASALRGRSGRQQI